MKRIFVCLLAAGALVLALNFTACKKGAGTTLTVGATPVPHAELLNLVADDLAAQGITLKVEEFTDYVQPNVAVLAGDLDANFFQHMTIVNLVGYSAMAGAIGGRGLGDLAIRYGYYRFRIDVTIGAVIVILILVEAVQMIGTMISRNLLSKR